MKGYWIGFAILVGAAGWSVWKATRPTPKDWVRSPRRLLEDIKLCLVSPWQAGQNRDIHATTLIERINEVLGLARPVPKDRPAVYRPSEIGVDYHLTQGPKPKTPDPLLPE